MAREHLEVLNNNSDRFINIQYEPPTMLKRVFSNFLDLIFLFLTFILCYIGVQAIVKSTPRYKNADQVVAQIREESGMFEYSNKRDTWENVSTYLDNNNDTSYDYRVLRCESAIDDFLHYVDENYPDHYEEIKKDYDDARLSAKMKDSKGNPLFAYSDAYTKPLGDYEACKNNLKQNSLTFTSSEKTKNFVFFMDYEGETRYSFPIEIGIDTSGVYSLDFSNFSWQMDEGVEKMAGIKLVRTGDQTGDLPKYKFKVTVNIDPHIFDTWGSPVTNLSLFAKTEGEPIVDHNPESIANAQTYYVKFYREYTLANCGGFMIKIIAPYRDGLKYMSNMLFFVQFPVAAFVSGILIYLLPGLIFKRGRSTFGKKLMKIGFVDPQILSPSLPRYIARWAIFFFGEFVLSFFTFGIPFIVSFSMSVFTKKHQTFPDFMLGLVEVDDKKQKIYFTKYEVALDNTPMYQEPVDFKMDKKD